MAQKSVIICFHLLYRVKQIRNCCDNTWSLVFFANEIPREKLKKADEFYIYYVADAINNIVKFGISKDPFKRINTHIAHFLSYGLAKKSKLKCRVSDFTVENALEAERLFLNILRSEPNIKPKSGNEFFVIHEDSMFNFDRMFSYFLGALKGRQKPSSKLLNRMKSLNDLRKMDKLSL